MGSNPTLSANHLLKMTGLKTCRELVDFALLELIRHQQQKKLPDLKDRNQWEGDLQAMRIDVKDGHDDDVLRQHVLLETADA